MNAKSWNFRRLLPAFIALLSCLVIGHHLVDLATVLLHGVISDRITVDFQTYMCGSRDLAAPYSSCRIAESVSGFVYPPPSLIYFHALSRLPIDLAFLVHSLVSAGSLAMACRMLLRLMPASRIGTGTALIAALAIAPIGTSLVAGQVNIIVMAACVAAVYFATVGSPARSGIAVALGFWLKLYPGIVPVLFLMTRRKFPAAVMAGLAIAGMAVLSLLWASPRLFVQYFLELLPHVQRYTMPGVAYSFTGMIAHVEAGGGAPIYHFVPISAAVQFLSKALLAAGIVAALLHQRLTRDTRPVESLSILLAAALIAAPNSWGYHFALIFPAIFAALAKTLERPSWTTPIVLLCWLALLVPGWTPPPAAIARIMPLNVLVQGRYGVVALILIALNFAELRSHALPDREPAEAC